MITLSYKKLYQACLIAFVVSVPQALNALVPVFFRPGLIMPNTTSTVSVKGAANDKVITPLLKAYQSQKPVLFLHYQKDQSPLYGVLGMVEKAIAKSGSQHTFIFKLTHVIELYNPMQSLAEKDGIRYVKTSLSPITVTSTPDMRDDFLALVRQSVPEYTKMPDSALLKAVSAPTVEEAFIAIYEGLGLKASNGLLVELLKRRSVSEHVATLKRMIEEKAVPAQGGGNHEKPVEDPESGTFRERAERLAPYLSEEIRTELYDALDHYELVENNPHEGPVMYNYLKLFLSLPWNTSTKDVFDLNQIEKELDASHYGMDDVKDRVLDYLALKQLNPSGGSTILCLAGPPGVGKTSICKGIAKAIGRKFNRVALGGVHAESDIRGHRKTYIGAMPGRIIDAMKKVGSNNAVIALDEIDKLATQNTHAGDPSAALLEVLDPEQNDKFVDHYLNVPFDLSKVFWIVTANYLDRIPPALRDRLDIIEVPGYTTAEKVHIAQNHLFPKLIADSGLREKKPTLSNEVLEAIIEGYTLEAGVRTLTNKLRVLIAKYARGYLRGEDIEFTTENLKEYLGRPYDFLTKIPSEDRVGLTNGLCVLGNSGMGTVSFIEGVKVPGTGKFIRSGNLKSMTEESAQAAHTYIRSVADEYRIDPELFKSWDIHVHMPGSATKDGDSAGCAFTTTILSVLTGRPVDHSCAMTGTINLRGLAGKIGGAKEKLLGAYRSGVKTIFFPEENREDIEDMKNCPKDIEIVFVKHVKEILDRVLLPKAS